MPERYMVDGARDRLVVANALMQKVHGRLRAGRLRLDQADAVLASLLEQMEHALALLDEASARVGTLPPRQPAAVPVVAETRRGTPW